MVQIYERVIKKMTSLALWRGDRRKTALQFLGKNSLFYKNFIPEYKICS